MSEESNKAIIDEADPQALAARADDPPGSFLDVYRSHALEYVAQDEQFVEKAIIEGVVPENVRYGIMRRGNMVAFRGVVKSTSGDLFYFNWNPTGDFKLVPSEKPSERGEMIQLFKSCTLGCDLIRGVMSGGSGPYPEEDDEDAEKAGGGGVPGAAVAPRDEEQWMDEQETMQHEVHPGSTQSGLPDDPSRGRNWHMEEEPLRRATDGMAPVATNDGEKHWTKASLMKAYGASLQESAPRLVPRADKLERQYLQEVLGATPEQIDKGLRLAPRHQVAFETWKSSRLRKSFSGLQSWLERHK